jgi:hypothetical protein
MNLVMLLAIGDFTDVIVALSRATMMSWNWRGYGDGIDDDRAVFCMITGLHA